MSTEITKTENHELDLLQFWTEAQIKALRSASFPDLNNSEFIVAMKIAKQYSLDPFAKEIWGWHHEWKTMVVVSNSGYMKIARNQPWFLSLTAQPVFKWDDFQIDFAKNEITHKVDFSNRVHTENPIWAYAILEYLSNWVRQKNIKFVSWSEYSRTSPVWNKNKSAMICKVATTVVCREVYWLSWLYTEEEIQKEEKPEPRTITPPDLSKIQIPEIISNPQNDDTTITNNGIEPSNT